jgi:hypothetical protein
MTYKEKLLDPRWQKKRLEILQRDNFRCQKCYDENSTLHIHHRKYLKNIEPWDCSSNLLVTLCERCHSSEKQEMQDGIKTIIEALKTKFFGNEIMEIAIAFEEMPFSHSSDLMTEAISFMLANEDQLLKNYYDTIKTIKEWSE